MPQNPQAQAQELQVLYEDGQQLRWQGLWQDLHLANSQPTSEQTRRTLLLCPHQVSPSDSHFEETTYRSTPAKPNAATSTNSTCSVVRKISQVAQTFIWDALPSECREEAANRS